MNDVARRRAERYAEAVRETRAGRKIELRKTDEGDFEFSGYATTFDVWYRVTDWLGEYQERVAPGAFTRTLAQRDDVALLVNHEGLPLARTSSGTLELRQDEIGLRSESTLAAKDPDVQLIVPKMERGDLSQMSMAFQAVRQEWNEDFTERTLVELKLFDVSIVTFPANPSTSAVIREAEMIARLAAAEPEAVLAQMRAVGDQGSIDDAIAVLEQLRAELRGEARDTTPTIERLRREVELLELSRH